MRPLFAVILIIFVAHPAYAHPGKTDRYGGHKCYKECAEWDLYYAEYHLHDKDGRPVRVVRKKPARSVPTATIVETEVVSQSLPTPPPVPAVPQVARAAMAPDDPGLPLYWLLLALLLLLFLVARRRRKGKIDGNDLSPR